jgi:hypothetical protein
VEADWSAEIGSGLPVIDAAWEGFVDLRRDPSAVRTIPEAVSFPGLAHALSLLNGEASAVFTSKSDVWSLTGDEIDRYEFDALASDARTGIASYIDVLQRDSENLVSYEFHERLVKQVAEDLCHSSLRNGRIDLVIRAANFDESEGFGVTLYAAGCGADTAAALRNWESVLTVAVLATMKVAGPNPPPAHLAGE